MATPHSPSPTPLLAVYSLIQGKRPSASLEEASPASQKRSSLSPPVSPSSASPPSVPFPSVPPPSTPPPSAPGSSMPPPSAPPPSASPPSASHSENTDASSRPAKKQKLRNRRHHDKRAQRHAESGIPVCHALALSRDAVTSSFVPSK
ncbi:hypothetical protein EV368DRAFT_89625 [Lentinula lateritia]|nr:hypothetical protein EV368DRAFT_89625 [Lentinula lateritia]